MKSTRKLMVLILLVGVLALAGLQSENTSTVVQAAR